MTTPNGLEEAMFDARPMHRSTGIVLTGRKGELPLLTRETIVNNLQRYGVVLLREFEATLAEFEDFTKRLTPDFLVHLGFGREFISQDGTTQTVARGNGYLQAHVERGYAPPIPSLVFFYCVRPADEDGATTIYDGFDVFETLSEEMKQFFLRNRLRWKMRVRPELWQPSLLTTDKTRALANFHRNLTAMMRRDLGEKVACSFDGDVLLIDFVTPTTRRAPRRPGESFANSGLTFLRRTGSGYDDDVELLTEDNAPFPDGLLEEVMERSERVVMPIKWNSGDVVCIDNHTVMHGRTAFTDPHRSIYIRIGMGHVVSPLARLVKRFYPGR
jgi:hypothetical protein